MFLLTPNCRILVLASLALTLATVFVSTITLTTTSSSSCPSTSDSFSRLTVPHTPTPCAQLQQRQQQLLPQQQQQQLLDDDRYPFIIPRTVHQSWKTTTVPSFTKADGIDYPYSDWIQSWPQKNPDWTYVFWTDEDNFKLFQSTEDLSEFRDSFNRVRGVVASDYARYAYLYVYGGVYADIDFECLRPFDILAMMFDAFISSEPADQSMVNSDEPVVPCNAIMGSRPKHQFWLKVMRTIKSNIEGRRCSDPVDCSGPRFLKKVYESYISESWGDPVTLLPSQYLYPEISKRNKKIGPACEQFELEGRWTCVKNRTDLQERWHSFAVHHWACQWCRRHEIQTTSIYELVPNVKRPFQ